MSIQSRFSGILAATLIAAVLMVFGTESLSAQDSTPTAVDSPPTVTVAGVGSVQASPDAAIANIGVSVTAPDLASAVDDASTSMAAVIDAIKSEGVADADIQTSSIIIQPVQNYDEFGNPNDIEQFQVTNMVRVTVRDIEQIGPVLDSSISAGANSIFGIDFVLTDRTDAEATAREMAVSDATERATQLASAAGKSLGEIVSIDETAVSTPVATGGAAGADEARSIPIESGTSSVSVRIEVVFELV